MEWSVARPKPMLLLLLCHPQVRPLCSNTPPPAIPAPSGRALHPCRTGRRWRRAWRDRSREASCRCHQRGESRRHPWCLSPSLSTLLSHRSLTDMSTDTTRLSTEEPWHALYSTPGEYTPRAALLTRVPSTVRQAGWLCLHNIQPVCRTQGHVRHNGVKQGERPSVLSFPPSSYFGPPYRLSESSREDASSV